MNIYDTASGFKKLLLWWRMKVQNNSMSAKSVSGRRKSCIPEQTSPLPRLGGRTWGWIICHQSRMICGGLYLAFLAWINGYE